MSNQTFYNKYIVGVAQKLLDMKDGSYAEVVALGAGIDLGIASASFTRPNDTTAYAISDVVGTNPAAIITLANVARVINGSGFISSARLVKSSNTTTNATFRAYFYKTAPTAIADNAQWTLLWANRVNRLGFVDFVLSSEGTGSDSASDTQNNVNIPFQCVGDVADIYAIVVAKAAYTPAAQEQFLLEVKVDRN